MVHNLDLKLSLWNYDYMISTYDCSHVASFEFCHRGHPSSFHNLMNYQHLLLELHELPEVVSSLERERERIIKSTEVKGLKFQLVHVRRRMITYFVLVEG